MNRLSKSNKPTELEFMGIDDESKPSYNATTSDITITVWPEFISNQVGPLGDLFIWAYHIKIENKSKENIKLLSRHWKIIDEEGALQEVVGEGVVGQQPDIAPHNSFKYSSGVHLSQPSGIMSGTYEMQKINGEKFMVKIPAFSLDSGIVRKSIN